MKKERVYRETEQFFGLAPPISELAWNLFKRVQLGKGPIPNKCRELIEGALSAISKYSYCSYLNTERARLNTATEEVFEYAIHFNKSSAGWNAYAKRLQPGYAFV
jgi:hypothetical protein